MYQDIFESIRNEAEKRNLRERTIQLYCSDVSYFLRWIGKPVSALTLEDAESVLTAKRLEGRSPETHNHYRSAIKFLYKKVLKIVWDDEDVYKRQALYKIQILILNNISNNLPLLYTKYTFSLSE